MSDRMISVKGYARREYDDVVIGRSTIPANIVMTIEDKEIAKKVLELFELGLERITCSGDNMKKIEALARGYNELEKSIKEAWEVENGRPIQ